MHCLLLVFQHTAIALRVLLPHDAGAILTCSVKSHYSESSAAGAMHNNLPLKGGQFCNMPRLSLSQGVLLLLFATGFRLTGPINLDNTSYPILATDPALRSLEGISNYERERMDGKDQRFSARIIGSSALM